MGRGVRAGSAYVEITADNTALMRGLAAAQSRLLAFGQAVRGVGLDMMAMSASMLAPITAGSKVYADFQQQMAMVATMLVKPKENMEAFTNGIAKMSVKFGEGTDTLSKGLYDILSAAIAPSKAMGVLEASAKAAKAGLSDTAVAVDAITTVLNSYGLGAEKAADVSDWLFQVVNRGKLTFNDMATDIGKSASLAHTAGLSLEEVGGFIATLTRNGVQSATAMTGLNAVIKSFLKPSVEAAKVAEDVGFELSGMALRTDGLFGSMQKLAGLSPDTLARLFPDIDALKGVLPAMNDMRGFAEDIKIMADRAGSTETAYKTMTNTMAFSFAQLKQEVVATMRTLGEAVSGNVGIFIEYSKAALTSIREWITKNQELVNTGARAAVIVGIIGAALVAASPVIVATSMALGAVSAAISFLVGIISFATMAAGLFWAAITSPVSLVLVGITALVAGFLFLAQSITGVFTETLAGLPVIWTLAQQTLEAAWALMKAVWSGDTAEMGAAWDLFKLNAIILWNNIWAVLEEGFGAMASVWDRKTEIMKAAWGWVTAYVSRQWDGVMAIVSRKWDEVWQRVAPAWEAMTRLWSEYGKTVLAVAVSVGVVVAIAKTLLATFAAVSTAVAIAGATITAVVAAVTSPLGILIIAIAGIAVAFYALVPKVKTSVDGMFGHLGKAWDAAWGILKAAWKLMTDTFSGNAETKKKAWSTFTKAIGPLWDTVKAELLKSWTALTGDWTHEITGMKGVWSDVLQGILVMWDALKLLLDLAFTKLANEWYEMTILFVQAWSNFTWNIQKKWRAAWDMIYELVWRLKDGFSLFVDWLKSSLFGALDSLISKLQSAWSWAKSLLGMGTVKVAVSAAAVSSSPMSMAPPSMSPALTGLTGQLNRQLASVGASLTVNSSPGRASSSAAAVGGDLASAKLLASNEKIATLLKQIGVKIDGISPEFG